MWLEDYGVYWISGWRDYLDFFQQTNNSPINVLTRKQRDQMVL